MSADMSTSPRALARPLLLLLLCFALLTLPTTPADAADSREFKGNNVKWSLPDGWTFADLTPQEKQAGFFAAVQGSGFSGRVLAYRQPDNGLQPQEFARELAQQANAEVPDGAVLAGHKGSISGRQAHVTTVDGKTGEAVIHVRTYLTHFKGHYYVLWIRAFHGHHKKKAEDLDAVRRGLRLLEGAGPEEKPDKFADPKNFGEGGGMSAEGEGEKVEGTQWKSEWPKREGNKLTWEKHNLTWTLPEDSGFKFHQIAPDEGTGLKLVLVHQQERASPPSNEEAAKKNQVQMRLVIQDRQPGFFAREHVKRQGFQNDATKPLGTKLPGTERVMADDLEIGGVPAGRFTCEGRTQHGDFTGCAWTLVGLKDKIYVFLIQSIGDRPLWASMQAQALKLLDGVQFPDPVEGVFGPVLGAVAAHNAQRGALTGAERTLRAPGVEFEKPVGLANLGNFRDASIRWAVEQRSEDGKSYFYMHLASFTPEELKQGRMTGDDFIQQRADLWKRSAGENADFKEKRGQIRTRSGRFGKGKGDKYEMTCTFKGTPFVEEGYWLKWKQNFYHVVIQYGGEDAEKTWKDLVKDIQKRMNWLK